MGEYRRGESRSDTSQLGMLVEQEAGKHAKLHVPNCKCGSSELHPGRHIRRHISRRVEQLVGCPRQYAGGDRWDLHDFGPLSAVHRRIVMGQLAELMRCKRGSEDQANRL
jgi:hypothetical protein